MRWVLCALQMCCNVRSPMRDFELNVLSLEGERNAVLGLRTTFEHLRCWREVFYVRPVGVAFRICEFEITVICQRIRSSQELMLGFGFWLMFACQAPIA